MAFDGVLTGISDALAKNYCICLGRCRVSCCPGLEDTPCADVDDGRPSLQHHQPQEFLVLARNLPSTFLPGEREVSNIDTSVTDRHFQKGWGQALVRDETERAHVGGYVRKPERYRELADVLDETRPVGLRCQPPAPLFGET